MAAPPARPERREVSPAQPARGDPQPVRAVPLQRAEQDRGTRRRAPGLARGVRRAARRSLRPETAVIVSRAERIRLAVSTRLARVGPIRSRFRAVPPTATSCEASRVRARRAWPSDLRCSAPISLRSAGRARCGPRSTSRRQAGRPTATGARSGAARGSRCCRRRRRPSPARASRAGPPAPRAARASPPPRG